ncbi:MAG: FAD-dependent oxidoreductase [Candidatus Adiutrix sp.]|jgi:NADPH-dependent 2,4-dienoyl-CoA reductase/sulfur reductase-like enzyme|nr:FAD-dependent oxidoreductase [Candidatus Adiutrix sp.]
MRRPDVLIVGGGPAGLAAALELAKNSRREILVIDRDEEAGGLPRYCGHPGFGWEYTGLFHHTGRRFAAFMVNKIAGRPNIRLMTRTTLLELAEGPRAVLLNPEQGLFECRPQALLLATGIREAPRAPRMLGGNRPPHAFLNTGHLQGWLTRDLPRKLPGQAAGAPDRAVILGTEWVSFSAWLSALRLGLTVTAFVETESRVQAPAVFGWGLANLLRVPVHTGAVIESVEGSPRALAGLWIRAASGLKRFLPCSRLIMTGCWRGDAAVAESAGLAVNPVTRCLAVDQFFRCDMDGVWAVGNVIQPLLDSGRSARLGRQAGATLARSLTSPLPEASVRLTAGAGVLSVSPARLADGKGPPKTGLAKLHLRAAGDLAGARLSIRAGDDIVWERHLGAVKASDNIFVPLKDLSPRLSGLTEAEARLIEERKSGA